MKTLYDYQEKAVNSFFTYWSNASGNPLVTAPVGAGKSLIIAEFIKRAISMYSDTRIVVLSHVAELLVQDKDELLEQWADAPYGIYCAALKRRDRDAQVLFASIQSVYNKAHALGKIELILIDEAHLVSPRGSTMYQRFIREAKEVNPLLKVGGVTGTPFRSGEGYLHEGKDRLFTDIIFEIPMGYLIQNNYLTPVITPQVETKMDVSSVTIRKGDYIESELQAAIDKRDITQSCVDEIIHHGQDRKKWLVFCAGVKHAYNTAKEFARRGIHAEVITGETPKDMRADTLRRFIDGELRCVVNVAVLTTGFNNPAIDLLAFMRPTRSPVLYIQCCGRGMRKAPGKTDCKVLDFGGIIDELGPIDAVHVPKKREGAKGEAPIKQCPECFSLNHAAARQCFNCDFVFPAPDIGIKKSAAKDKAILSSQIKSNWVDVDDVSYETHFKKGKPPSVKVTYQCGIIKHREWVCPEHDGYARTKFEQWFQKRTSGGIEPPFTVKSFLKCAKFLKKPSQIRVKKDGKYMQVLDYGFQS